MQGNKKCWVPSIINEHVLCTNNDDLFPYSYFFFHSLGLAMKIFKLTLPSLDFDSGEDTHGFDVNHLSMQSYPPHGRRMIIVSLVIRTPSMVNITSSHILC